MIDVNDPAQLDPLMVRLQARRVAHCYRGAGRKVPPLAARILADDTDEQMEQDAVAYAAWCAARCVECVRILGISEFTTPRVARPRRH
jgi:hypothetical protein